MKKLFLLLASFVMIAFFATSCCNCDKGCPKKDECVKEEMSCQKEGRHHGPKHHKGHPDGKRGDMKHHGDKDCKWSPEQKEMCQKWMKFDSLSTDEQKALLKERKAMIDKREADWAAKKAEMEQKKAEMEQKWANFDNLSIEEQKQLIEWKSFCPKKGKFGHPDKCRGPKKDCSKECPTEE